MIVRLFRQPDFAPEDQVWSSLVAELNEPAGASPERAQIARGYEAPRGRVHTFPIRCAPL